MHTSTLFSLLKDPRREKDCNMLQAVQSQQSGRRQQGCQSHENIQRNTVKQQQVGEVSSKQVLARWGGQVCVQRSERVGSTSTRPESTGRNRSWDWRWVDSLRDEGMLLAGGEMFCREEQRDAGLWVWKEGGRRGKLVQQHKGAAKNKCCNH